MTLLKKSLLTSAVALLSLTFAAPARPQTGQPPQGGAAKPQDVPRGQPGDVPAGWQRHQLDGGGGEWISVLLPSKPEDFGVANMRRPSGDPLKARVYMTALDGRAYFAAFVDLPKPVAETPDRERGEAFYGSWMAFAAKTGQALGRGPGPPPVTPSDQLVREMPGGERRRQDFKLGTQGGRAQAILAGRRIYMVAAIWDGRPGSEQDAARFLNSFQVKPAAGAGAETGK